MIVFIFNKDDFYKYLFVQNIYLIGQVNLVFCLIFFGCLNVNVIFCNLNFLKFFLYLYQLQFKNKH